MYSFYRGTINALLCNHIFWDRMCGFNCGYIDCPKVLAVIKLTILSVDLDVANGSGGGPDGDIDDPEDGTHGYIPGKRGNANILSWSSGTLSPQPLKIVALAPDVASVRFELVSYTIAGTPS